MDYFKKNRFLLFLIFLLCIIAYPIFAKSQRSLELLSTIFFTALLLSGLYAFSQRRMFLRFTGMFFIVAIVLEWFHYFSAGNLLNSLQPLVTSLVLLLLLVMTLKSIYSARVVDQNVIFGVVSGYVLIGFIGALFALSIARSYPGAFNLPEMISSPEAIYFSFVTMTTLGYGDITPAIQETRSLSVLLSIVGPMYVAIIVALMAGKFSATKKAES